MPYELLLKQTLRTPLRTLPRDQRMYILDKLDVLSDDPSPDGGKVKKNIHLYQQEAICLLRSGNYHYPVLSPWPPTPRRCAASTASIGIWRREEALLCDLCMKKGGGGSR